MAETPIQFGSQPPPLTGAAISTPAPPDPDDPFLGPTQEHHLIPWSNRTWNHQGHPLVRQAGLNLRTAEGNTVPMANHAGRHSTGYHQTVRQMMDRAYIGVRGKGPEAAQAALRGVMADLRSGIRAGLIRPYDGKAVLIP
jgi:hypothetical protein